MQQLLHCFYGFTLLSIGVALPGLVNMTTVRICLNRGFAAAMRFNAGAAAAVLVHAYIAIAFAGLFGRHPSLLVYLRQLALFFFLILSFVFFYQALRKEAARASRRRGRPLLLGFLVSIANVLNIPSVFAFSTYLRARGHMVFSAPYRFFFVLGAAVGAFAMLSLYAAFAKSIRQNSQSVSQRLNYFLSGLFLLLALVQGIQIYYS